MFNPFKKRSPAKPNTRARLIDAAHEYARQQDRLEGELAKARIALYYALLPLMGCPVRPAFVDGPDLVQIEVRRVNHNIEVGTTDNLTPFKIRAEGSITDDGTIAVRYESATSVYKNYRSVDEVLDAVIKHYAPKVAV